MRTNVFYAPSKLARFLALLSLMVLILSSGAALGATVIDVDFDGGDATNAGTGNDGRYDVFEPKYWEPNGAPENAFTFISHAGEDVVKLSKTQGIEFDSDTANAVVASGLVRVSMRFRIENLIENPKPHDGAHVVRLFAISNDWDSYTQPTDGGFKVYAQRTGVNKAEMKLESRDGVNSTDTMTIFSDVDTDKWLQLDLVFDTNNKILTAQLDDQYFHRKLDTWYGSIGWGNIFSVIDDKDQLFRVYLGAHFVTNPREEMLEFLDVINDGHLIVDHFTVHTTVPPAAHGEYASTLREFTSHVKALAGQPESTLMTGPELYQAYVEDFLPFHVFQQKGHYLSAETAHKYTVNTLMDAFESTSDPLFSDRSLSQGLHKYPIIERVISVLQNDIVVTHFNDTDLESVASLVFESRESFPGVVSGTLPASSAAVQVAIDGDVNEYSGVNGRWPTHRPTGYWALAGEKVQVCIPTEALDHGLDVIVGAHPPLNLSRSINRAFNIVTKFNFEDDGCTDVANPYGGGIYVRVPANQNLGWLDVDIDGKVVAAPFFDNRADRPTGVGKTTRIQWKMMFRTAALPPWADLESDNIMLTVPVPAAKLVMDAAEALDTWDDMYAAVSAFQGRDPQRPRAEYFVMDSTSFCSGCAAYWMTLPHWTVGQPVSSRKKSDTAWEYNYGLAPFNINKDPNFSSTRRFDHALHEKGHLLRHPTLKTGNEEEAKANIIKLVGRTDVLGNSYADALLYHNRKGMTEEEVVMDWLIMDEFIDIYERSNWRYRSPSLNPLGTMPLRAYASRPMMKYIDLARDFGDWTVVGAIMKAFYQTYPDIPADHRSATDDQFTQMAVKAFDNNGDWGGVNPLPLLEFWGIVPTEETRTAATDAGLTQSAKIKSRLEHYLSLVPPTKSEFYTRYKHIIESKRLVFTRERFKNAYDTYETRNVNGVIGYPAIIAARFQQIFDDYFGALAPVVPTPVEYSEMVAHCQLVDNGGYEVQVEICNQGSASIVLTEWEFTDSNDKDVFLRSYYGSGVSLSPLKSRRLFLNYLSDWVAAPADPNHMRLTIRYTADASSKSCGATFDPTVAGTRVRLDYNGSGCTSTVTTP